MALIQKIRGMSALVLILMFLAIFAFIGMLVLQDANPNGSPTGIFGNSTTLAKVAGASIDVTEFDRKAEIMYGNAAGDLGAKNQLFNFWVEENIINNEAQKLGLGISKDELLDLQFGPNPSPAILQNQALANPQTGQVDPQQLASIKERIQKNELPLDGKVYWAEVEKQVIKERLQTKLNNLVDKGIYTPSWMVDESLKELTLPADIEYVKVPYTAVDDKDVTVSDSEIEAYIKENKSRYQNEEETRVFEYVSFPVTPTVADSGKLRDRLLSLREGFRTTTKDSSYVAANNGMFTGQYMKKDALTGLAKDSLADAAIGSVVGPYVDGKTFVLAKLIDRRSSADTVSCRHILIQGAGAQKTADSLKAILDVTAGAWDSLNTKFNTDPGSKDKGGVYENVSQGMMVAEFNDLLFFKAQQGKFYTVATRFGVHVVQLTGVKSNKGTQYVKVAYLRENIVPSADTDREVRSTVTDLLTTSKTAADLQKNALAKGMALQPAPPARQNDPYMGQFGQATGVRQIIRWMFDAEVGERCKEVFSIQQQGEPFVSQYVVGALKQVNPKGLMSVAMVKDQLMALIRNQKKGEILKGKIGSVSDLNALASQYASKVDTARGLTFNANMIPNLGNEGKLLATAFATPIGSISPAVVGESGVFALKVLSRQAIENAPYDKNILRAQMTSQSKNSVRAGLMRALKKEYDVTDNRAKFY
jgi:peptidyl-prolyl cis-trans isomerase D